jgi:hypothetical protein
VADVNTDELWAKIEAGAAEIRKADSTVGEWASVARFLDSPRGRELYAEHAAARRSEQEGLAKTEPPPSPQAKFEDAVFRAPYAGLAERVETVRTDVAKLALRPEETAYNDLVKAALARVAKADTSMSDDVAVDRFLRTDAGKAAYSKYLAARAVTKSLAEGMQQQPGPLDDVRPAPAEPVEKAVATPVYTPAQHEFLDNLRSEPSEPTPGKDWYEETVVDSAHAPDCGDANCPGCANEVEKALWAFLHGDGYPNGEEE